MTLQFIVTLELLKLLMKGGEIGLSNSSKKKKKKIGLSLIQVTLLLSKTVVPISISTLISWTPDPSGEFTVSSAWNHFRPKMPIVNWHYSSQSSSELLHVTS